MKDVNIKFHAALLCSLLCAIFWGCSDNDDKKDYIAEKSGHTRGSTIDLTIFDMQLEKEVDMGCTYDYFGVASHPDVLPGQEIGAYKPINQQQYDNRMILQRTMMAHGFKPYDCEWWHFTLANEPFPDTYFTFPIARSSLNE